MHEAAHRSFLSNREWNDRIGNWFGAYPIWARGRCPTETIISCTTRRPARTEDPGFVPDAALPDLEARCLGRKVWRDLSPDKRAGSRSKATFKRDVGFGQRSGISGTRGSSPAKSPTSAGTRSVALRRRRTLSCSRSCSALAGRPELYLLWPVALMTTYRLVPCVFVRSRNTRCRAPPTIRSATREPPSSRWWERLFFAPNFVNYHLEHHLLDDRAALQPAEDARAAARARAARRRARHAGLPGRARACDLATGERLAHDGLTNRPRPVSGHRSTGPRPLPPAPGSGPARCCLPASRPRPS